MLHTASNPTIISGSYTVVQVLRGGVLAVYNGRNRTYREETVSFIDASHLTAEEWETINLWQADDETNTTFELDSAEGAVSQ